MRLTVPPEEQDLITRLLAALLREDVAGLRTTSRFIRDDARPRPAPHSRPAPHLRGWLAFRSLRIPVRSAVAQDDLLADFVVRAPVVMVVRPGRRRVVRRLGGVVSVVRGELRDPDLVSGFGVLREEALAALLSVRLRRRARARVVGGIRRADVTGWAGHPELETLAALRDHPLYPTSAAKVGLTAPQIIAWAPEHRPTPGLRWCTTTEPVERHGELPAFWPGADVVPLHPGTPLPPGATILDVPPLRVRPGLSLRTVVPTDDPGVHLKLPMPLRTLGRLNLRSLPRRGLADAALLTGVLTAVRDADPGLSRLGVADETTWLHADPMLAVLVRRWPAVEPGTLVAPVAALPALPWLGRPLDDFVTEYLRLVLGVHVRLWLRHGIVLEAHPQNVLLVVPPAGDLRLLVRDLDSARLDPAVLTPEQCADPRLRSTDPGEPADLFVTTTLHQCVAATLIALAHARGRPPGPWLRQVRPLLAELADEHPDARDTPLVRRILAAPRLPVKRHLTAATLLPKSRTAAADVNKFYGADAPTYV